MIFELVLKIPKGKVTTYKILGEMLNIPPRYVARLLSLNKDLNKYPCYKVVHSDGRVGGYVLGVNEKIRRLEKEEIEVFNGYVLDFNQKLFKMFIVD